MFLRTRRLFPLTLVLLSAGGVMAFARSGKAVAGADEKRAPMAETQDRIPGEYLVTVQKGGDQALIRQLFAQYSIREVRSLGDSLFLLRVDEDPGPEAIKRKGEECAQIASVQPNFVYRINRPQGNLHGPGN